MTPDDFMKMITTKPQTSAIRFGKEPSLAEMVYRDYYYFYIPSNAKSLTVKYFTELYKCLNQKTT